jgi:hypothetical protein
MTEMDNGQKWTDGGTANLIYALLGQQWKSPTLRLPAVCPRCGKIGVHLYFNDGHPNEPFDESRPRHRGGGWAWCSACQGFGHGSWYILPWWKNLPADVVGTLYVAPFAFDLIKDTIDAHWNSLVDRYNQLSLN